MPEFRDWSDCTIPDDLQKTFHDHLDVCKQCEQNPFDLCEAGAAIMRNISHQMAKRPIRIMDEVLKGETWPQTLTAEALRGVKYDPLIFSQEYLGEPFDPFKDDCTCGHSKVAHTRAHSGHVGSCIGTVEEHCYCKDYIKKSKENNTP